MIVASIVEGGELVPVDASDTASVVKDAVDIVDLVGRFVSLRRVGNRHVGLCPFHQEKTPSFQVDAGKQFFYCFGCGAGGDAIKFVMLHENMTFGDALRYLADRYNVTLPERDRSASWEHGHELRKERQRLRRAVQWACDYFYRRLHHSAEGASAREYIRKRGLPDSVVEEQRLGYAPAGWDNLLKHLKHNGVDPEEGVRAGLLIKNAKNHVYDRFRNRLIFPITDDRNRVVAFGGRSLDGSEPKYLNSPESPVYHKGRMLYQLAASREACRDARQVVLVEGYMDLLAFHAHGFRRVSATLGTALTPQQVRLLARMADEVVLVYDADQAGRRAMMRALPLFLKEQLAASCLTLPDGMDPDDFLRDRGLQELEALMEKRQDLGTFTIEKTLDRWDGTVGGKAKIINELEPIFSATRRSALHGEYLPLVCERLRLSEKAVLRHLHYSNRSSSKSGSGPPAARAVEAAQTRSLEESVVRIMIKYPELTEQVRRSEALKHFQETQLMTLAHVLLEAFPAAGGTFDPNTVYDSLSKPEHKELFARLLVEENTFEDPDFARLRLEHDLRALQERSTRAMPRQWHDALKEAQQKGDMARVKEILGQMQQFCSARKGLREQ